MLNKRSEYHRIFSLQIYLDGNNNILFAHHKRNCCVEKNTAKKHKNTSFEPSQMPRALATLDACKEQDGINSQLNHTPATHFLLLRVLYILGMAPQKMHSVPPCT